MHEKCIYFELGKIVRRLRQKMWWVFFSYRVFLPKVLAYLFFLFFETYLIKKLFNLKIIQIQKVPALFENNKFNLIL
jgi:hypothetical protein